MGLSEVPVATAVLAGIGLFIMVQVAKRRAQEQRVIEPIKMPKFPKVSDITRPILQPVQKIQTQVTNIPKQVTDVKNVVGKQIQAVEKQVGKQIKLVEGKIVAGFDVVFSWIRRAIAFVLFFPQCFLWYMLHVGGYMLYAPVAFFVWVFRLQAIERLVFEYVERADKIVHAVTGVHPFHFSSEIQARCYFSPSKMRDLREERRKAAGGGGKWLSDPEVDDSESVGYALAGLLVLCLGVICVAMLRPAPNGAIVPSLVAVPPIELM